MSGLAGIVHLDGAPLATSDLLCLVESLAAGSPDGGNHRLYEYAGLCHALLRTSARSEQERQPLSLDGQVWIVADVRLDGRADLVRSLQARGIEVDATATDAEFVLHAYSAWGEECVAHLLGDFAFALWDVSQGSLFCVRDHLGIKPLFYSWRENVLVFSNSLNTVRAHPGVRDRLDEGAIGDHLILGANVRPEATFFSDIRCLPPGHSLEWSSRTGPRLKRYWTLSDLSDIRYRRHDEYVEHFREIFDSAVEDRMQTDRVAVLMSGGLDSTSVAVTAHLLQGRPSDLQAWTLGSTGLIENDERAHADLVSQTLGIPHHYLREEDYRLYTRYQPENHTPASVEGPLAATIPLLLQGLDGERRVALMGHNAEVFCFCQEEVLHLVKTFRIGRLLADFREHFQVHRDLPRLDFFRSTVKRHLYRWGWRRSLAPWLNPDFERRLQLRDRWERVWLESCESHGRVESYLRHRSNDFPHVLEALDPSQTASPVEVRQPLADIRLVRFILSIPAVPWAVNKHILREAMRGRLPEKVRLRPKTMIPMPQRLRIHLDRESERWRAHLHSAPGLAEYVSIPKAEAAIERLEARNFREAYEIIAPLSLAVWLNRIRS